MALLGKLDHAKLLAVLNAGDARGGLALGSRQPATAIGDNADVREILRLAALGALLEQHVQFEFPVETVQGLYREFKAEWPRDTP